MTWFIADLEEASKMKCCENNCYNYRSDGYISCAGCRCTPTNKLPEEVIAYIKSKEVKQ